MFKTHNAVLNVKDLDRFDDGTQITEAVLREAGLVKGVVDGVKLLGDGDVTKKFILKDILVSQSAKEKIETAGGSVE
jgi:large subunit ribosomal protein L15